MLKYEDGKFSAVEIDDVIPGTESGAWEDAIKGAGFQHWGDHGNAETLNVVIYRRYFSEMQKENWLIDVSGITGGYALTYCPSEADFMACLVAMGPLICAAEVGSITSPLEEAAEMIRLNRRKESWWGVAEMLREIIDPLISRNDR